MYICSAEITITNFYFINIFKDHNGGSCHVMYQILTDLHKAIPI